MQKEGDFLIKAIFFDIDGTLISFKTHKMPNSTVSVLKDLKSKGIKLFIASGRTPSDMKFLLKDFKEIFDGYIGLNGQYCYDKDDNVIRKEWIEKSDLIAWTDFIKGKDILCGFMELEHYYYNTKGKALEKLKADLGDTLPERPVESIQRIYEYDTYQMNVFLSKDEEDIITKYMKNSRLVRWCPYFTDVIPKDGGKSVGIKAMLKHFGINQDECMAFGDGGNDVEMLEFAGIGVAMGNAEDKAKNAADYVTKDIDDDGIVYALKHFNIV